MTILGARVEVDMTWDPTPAVDALEHARARVQLRARIKSCTACHLHREQWVREPVPWRGPSPADVVVVGEAPGERENREGRPFVGPAGKLLDRMLGDAGWDIARVMYINAVACYPGRAPDEYAIKACRPNLMDQVALANTPFVILAGNVALQSFRPDLSVMNMAGSVFVQGGRVFLPVLHPAYVLRNRVEQDDTTLALAAFRQVTLELPWTNLIGDRCGKCYSGATHHDPEGVGYCAIHWETRPTTWTERKEEERRVNAKRMAKARVNVRKRKQGEIG